MKTCEQKIPLSINAIDWKIWLPDQRATLLFIHKNGQLLLIEKKRGLGAGKINAPGGRLEPGESPRQAAIRETQEEICVTPQNLTFRGELYFQFTDGLKLFCTVFSATDYSGKPCETDEANPFWIPVTKIPYEKMWRDDREWLPLMLKNIIFSGYFIFERDEMLDFIIETDT